VSDDEVHLSSSMDPELENALGRLERRLAAVETELAAVHRAGKDAGNAVEAGMDQAARGSDRAARAANRAARAANDAGDEAATSGRKAAVSSFEWDKFAKSMDKASKKAGGVGSILSAYKWGGIATGVFALAGGMSALGAGAVIAVGGLAPVVTSLGAALPLMATAKLGIYALNQGLIQSVGPLKDWKKNFDEGVGRAVAAGGLGSGMVYLTRNLGAFQRQVNVGFAGFGAELGVGARSVADLVRSGPFLRQIGALFAGMRPILADLIAAALSFARAVLNVMQAALPVTREFTGVLRGGAQWLQVWSAQQLANGNMTRWIMQGYVLLARIVGVLVDVFVGLFNIFRIGAGYAGQMGLSIEESARQFRQWTASAEGQQRINQYFLDSLPALREMGRLVAQVVGFLGHLGASQNVAPLLAQIRTELLPVLGQLITNLSGQGGLGPALISAVTALLKLFQSLDFNTLTAFAQALAAVINGVIWIAQNVPGASFAMSSLLSAWLGFKLLTPVFKAVASGAEAFVWMRAAGKMEGELSGMQRFLGGKLFPALGQAGRAFGTFAMTGVRALMTLSAALFTTPVGWIILGVMAIVAVIILLWIKCAWFRDLVKGVWQAILTAALAVWNALKVAWNAVMDALSAAFAAVTGALKTAWNAVTGALITAFLSVRDFIVGAWRWIFQTVKAIWDTYVIIWKAIVNAIIGVVMWIWDHGFKQVFGIIVAITIVQFNIIKGIIQTIIYIIVAIIVVLAYTFRWVWQTVAAGAQWLWDHAIKPVIDTIVGAWNRLINQIRAEWDLAVGLLSAAWNAFYSGAVKPVVDAITTAWNATTSAILIAWNAVGTALAVAWNWLYTTAIQPIVNGISAAWSGMVTAISAAWNWFYSTVVQPVVNAISMIWGGLVNGISSGWNWLVGILSSAWNGFKDAVGIAVDWIAKKWGDFTSWISSAFAPVGTAFTGMWEGIKNAATSAADVVKGAWNTVLNVLKSVWNLIAGAWNAIPEIHVPDWVPGIGGTTVGLPKLPTLYTGGPTPGGAALVGEHGPEPLLMGGRLAGILGARGPEIANLPRGGYVLPNLNTMAAGMAKRLPAPIAASAARAVPAYARAGAAHDPGLRAAVRDLAGAVRDQRPPIVAHGDDTANAVLDALRTHDRERRARGTYDYQAGEG
jgi:phage-related protein